MLSCLHSQIPVTWQPCSLLTKKREYAITICTVRVHDFFAPKLDWNLTNLGRMCWIPGKTDRKNAWVLLLSLLLHAPTSPDRFWKWPCSTAMCMAMQIFGLVSLKRWLPMNHRELPELLEIEFEAILPGRKQHDQRNKQHPIIRNFLDETVR